MFRKLTFFRFPAVPFAGRADFLRRLDDGARDNILKPVGPNELTRTGWVSPLGRELQEGEDAPYSVRADLVVLALGIETRLLPPSVVDAELRRRMAEVERVEDRKLGGRARKRLKEDVVAELLPRALVKPSRTVGFLDLDRGLVVVDTSSRKAAEGFISELRTTLGSFPALPVSPTWAPRARMTDWLGGENRLCPFGPGDEAELRDPVDGGAVAKLRHQDLQSDEVRPHLYAGKVVTQLGLTLADRVAFVLGEDMTVRKFTLLDVVLEQHSAADHESREAELDARYTILAAEVGGLFDKLAEAFAFAPVEG